MSEIVISVDPVEIGYLGEEPIQIVFIEDAPLITISMESGADGKDGVDGQDGYTPIKGVDYFDGINGKDGTNGVDGEDGYTPIKGVDYFDGINGHTPVKGVDYFDGVDGGDGREVELQKSATHIQWRYVGDVTWLNLVALTDIKGDQGIQGIQGNAGIDGDDGIDGKSVEIQNNGTYIQWRLIGDTTWINIVALIDLKGDQGIQGIQGIQGVKGDDGITYREFTFLLHVEENASVGNNKCPIVIVTAPMTIQKVYLKAKVAPVGSDFILDLNKNGVSIWNTNQANRVRITSGNTYGVQTLFDTTSLSEGDFLTVDIDQIGSVVAGQTYTGVVKCVYI